MGGSASLFPALGPGEPLLPLPRLDATIAMSLPGNSALPFMARAFYYSSTSAEWFRLADWQTRFKVQFLNKKRHVLSEKTFVLAHIGRKALSTLPRLDTAGHRIIPGWTTDVTTRNVEIVSVGRLPHNGKASDHYNSPLNRDVMDVSGKKVASKRNSGWTAYTQTVYL